MTSNPVDERAPDRGSIDRATDGAPADERSHRLEAALAELGVHAQVESRDALAIIALTDDASPSLAVELRRACVREAQRAGFTHIALEIAPRPRAR